MNWDTSANWERSLEIYEALSRIEVLLQKLVEKGEKKTKTVEVETTQGPVKVLINGIPVEEGDEII